MGKFDPQLPRPFVAELQVTDEWAVHLRKAFTLHAARKASSAAVAKVFDMAWVANDKPGLRLVE